MIAGVALCARKEDFQEEAEGRNRGIGNGMTIFNSCPDEQGGKFPWMIALVRLPACGGFGDGDIQVKSDFAERATR